MILYQKLPELAARALEIAVVSPTSCRVWNAR